ncbi:uncharacterized protein HD556DRAFT_1428520 [Suillus plorans]|uniref:CxC2-like cysteine cluster KDZ transposase-associated domain-containing protein n=1 Tax=Suillus plorans TaxID=116603 RepID=A0A9P7DYH6_9AGAM|nr:uncharacterized protein HD556DRAFT_1428520 [Suillus plorans]KAG1806398.1 hypothetical protein HD556DRAFT_1428520 [Suillus plorans]
MMCRDCIIKCHASHPLHRIDEWNKKYFQCTSLKYLGLHVQLGHSPGEQCLNAKSASGDGFVVVDVHGIHEIGLDYCGCEKAQIHYIQLLCARWFPATSLEPQTAATFALLEMFHLLSFESKVSAYEFYHSLARRSDNMGMTPIKWRNLKAFKRAGKSHDPDGLESIDQGDCVVLCPACPQPGKNLPDDWEDAPSNRRWLYALFLAIDANFRLKRKAVSSDERDPSLNAGSAYFVEGCEYKTYLAERIAVPQEWSMCVSHNAVNMADTKSSRGLAATGVGTVDCAQYEMKLAHGVGDLQKGEKYKIWNCLNSMPPNLWFDREKKHIQFVVPKFHLNAHIPACQTRFSFNYSKGVGRTDGEAPERGWANINQVATSTKEMGPGSCRDTLDDNFSDWNWKKVTMFGHTLICKLKDTVICAKSYGEELTDLECGINEVHLTAWTSEVEAWEEDNSELNPFESRVTSMTQTAVRLRLAENEACNLEGSINTSLHDEISPFQLISSGLDLEDQQHWFRADTAALGVHATETRRTNLCVRGNTLRCKIKAWTVVQALYMPAVVSLHAAHPSADSAPVAGNDKPENLTLWLPSALLPAYQCNHALWVLEWDLRFAQANDALNEVRQTIRLSSHLKTVKRTHICGQRASTCARSMLDLAEMKKMASKLKYNNARSALLTLGPLLGKVAWKESLRVLHSEGTQDISWIWKAPDCMPSSHSIFSNSHYHSGLHIEWCKAQARTARWSEGVLSLLEEMCRVIEFFWWQSRWWKERGGVVVVSSSAYYQEGALAYAEQQVCLQLTMANHCQ